MEIHVTLTEEGWSFDIRAKNGKVLAIGKQFYASRRNAVDAAKLIAKSKLKVVVKE